MHGVGRSSFCAQQSRLGERPFYIIILQRELPNLGVEAKTTWALNPEAGFLRGLFRGVLLCWCAFHGLG